MSEYDAKTICRKHEWTWKPDYPEHGIFCGYCGKPNKRLCGQRFIDRNNLAAICTRPRSHAEGHIGEEVMRSGRLRMVCYEKLPTDGKPK